MYGAVQTHAQSYPPVPPEWQTGEAQVLAMERSLVEISPVHETSKF